MKKRIISLILCAVFVCGAFIPQGAAWADTAGPEITAQAAIIYCADTGEVIWEKNADQQMEPASMTKLLTCLLAVENLDLDHVVTVPEEATEVIPTKIYLQAGEQITVEELLYAALLYSANDAAAALAIETAGSIEAFSEMMNERAEEIGCTATNFVNPHGLSEEGHLSTAADMALIAEEALDNETVREISGTVEHTIPATNVSGERELNNFNVFLYGKEIEINGTKTTIDKYDGVFGGKTGSLSSEYCTMVTGLETDGLEIYTVIMGTTAADRFQNMKILMDYGVDNVSNYTAFKKAMYWGKSGLQAVR